MNAYLVVLVLGLADRLGSFGQIPDVLGSAPVLIAAAVLYAVEFVTDKIPYVDSTWDAISTVIRPAIAAVLAVLASGDADSLQQAAYAVLGGGIDDIYPSEHRSLYERLVEEGCVVSESAPGRTATAKDLPRRNRIISGLSRAVVVIEAELRSGSLITARLAAEQGREVLAVPGSPLDPRCHGTNNLLRQGATLVERADDVLRAIENLRPPTLAERQRDLFSTPIHTPAPAAGPDESDLAKARALVLENLGHSPVTIDELVRGCQLSAPVVLTVVLELELAGRVQRLPGHQVSLA